MTNCSHLNAIIKRKERAEKALAQRIVLIAHLDKKISEHQCQTKRIEPVVPDIDVETLGAFNYSTFFTRMYGRQNYLYPVDLWQFEISEALIDLSPRLRFVMEARMRGATYICIAKLMGISRERARQIEAKTFRMLRHPLRAMALHTKVKEFEKHHFCELQETDEIGHDEYKIEDRLVHYQFNWKRCIVCGQRSDENKGPFCPGKTMEEKDFLTASAERLCYSPT